MKNLIWWKETDMDERERLRKAELIVKTLLRAFDVQETPVALEVGISVILRYL